MHPRDLEEFRDKVAIPTMQRLFDNTDIPEGACYIDDLKVSLLDGRSWGRDSQIEASGLSYHDGLVEEYHFSEYDIDLRDFLASHAGSVFLFDGRLTVVNELEDMDVRTRMWNLPECERIFPELACDSRENMTLEFQSVVFEKMKFLLRTRQKESEHAEPSVDELKQEAKDRAAEKNATRSEQADAHKQEHDPER